MIGVPIGTMVVHSPNRRTRYVPSADPFTDVAKAVICKNCGQHESIHNANEYCPIPVTQQSHSILIEQQEDVERRAAEWHGGTQANAVTLLEQAMSCKISEEAKLEIRKIRDKLKREAL